MDPVKVTLQPREYEVLSRLCRIDIRSLAGQLRYLPHEETQLRGGPRMGAGTHDP